MNGKTSRLIRKTAVATKGNSKELKKQWNDCPSHAREDLAKTFHASCEEATEHTGGWA